MFNSVCNISCNFLCNLSWNSLSDSFCNSLSLSHLFRSSSAPCDSLKTEWGCSDHRVSGGRHKHGKQICWAKNHKEIMALWQAQITTNMATKNGHRFSGGRQKHGKQICWAKNHKKYWPYGKHKLPQRWQPNMITGSQVAATNMASRYAGQKITKK